MGEHFLRPDFATDDPKPVSDVEFITVENIKGEHEALADFQQYNRNRKINGEKTITMGLVSSENNKHSYNLLEEESTITHGDDEYIIKKVSERTAGKKTIKRVDGIHKFYVDMINKQQPKIHNGSITFNNYMNMVFEGTGYTFATIGSFPAREFQNLGNDNRLSLLSKGLERFKAEMELAGNEVRFREQIGNNTDFQFRYGHNIKTIDKNVDTTNLTTVIRGKWEDGMELEYRSPNADIFGELEAPLFDDERFTTRETRLEAMKDSLEDTPEFSITIDFADLRAAGYPYTIPNEGDRVFVIYEPMNDLLLETRILEIDETFDDDLKPIKTNVTLANHKKTFAGTMFDNVQKQLGKIVDDDGVIKYDILDQAVKVATEALHSAQTELEFNNGILAIDKNNPNRVVLFNSAGIGISDDGGQTFSTAMTGAGIVADVITTGILRGLELQGNEIYGGLIEGTRFKTTGSNTGEIEMSGGVFTSDQDQRNATISYGRLQTSSPSLFEPSLKVKSSIEGPLRVMVEDSRGNSRQLGVMSIVTNGSNINNAIGRLEIDEVMVGTGSENITIRQNGIWKNGEQVL
jgi:hypothetical protein